MPNEKPEPHLPRNFGFAHVILAAIVVLAPSCKTFTSRDVSDPKPAVARLRAGGSLENEVNELAEPLIKSGEYPGLIVAVVTPDGATRTFRYGWSGRPGDPMPPGPDTIFELGSVSKVFLASLLEILVSEGQLRYDDTVRGILPANVPVSKEVGELTLYELVIHIGGLPREPVEKIQLWWLVKYLFTGSDLYGYISKDYLYQYLRTCQLKPKGKRGFEYSNFGSGLLGHLIELKTGRSLSELMQAKICGPLGLKDTVYVLSEEQKRRLAGGHAGDQPKFVPRGTPMEAWDMGEIMSGPSGLYSTAHDLAIFARANLGMLHLPVEPALARTHRVQLVTPEEEIAYDWVINRLDGGKTVLTFKHGMVAGYSGYVGMNLDRHIAVVWLGNAFNWRDKLGHNLLLRLSNGLPPEPAD